MTHAIELGMQKIDHIGLAARKNGTPHLIKPGKRHSCIMAFLPGCVAFKYLVAITLVQGCHDHHMKSHFAEHINSQPSTT
jgi:hypothetical protein